MEDLVIDPRFNGPPDSANGGYTCGCLAGQLQAHSGVHSVEVTLRQPPPLGVPMSLDLDEQQLRLTQGQNLVAQAKVAGLDLEVPAWPGWEAAEEAEKHYVGHRHHPFPTCFVCGPGRDNGLGIFAGPLGPDRVTAIWTLSTSTLPR